VVNSADECNALGDLYYAANGSGWNVNGGWVDAAAGMPTDLCSFTDTVICSGAGGPVVYLQLASNGLKGTIPPSLGSMTTLYELFLSYNALSGSIPDSIGACREIGVLAAF